MSETLNKGENNDIMDENRKVNLTLNDIKLANGFNALNVLTSLHKIRNNHVMNFTKELLEDIVINYKREWGLFDLCVSFTGFSM